jgi:hypothetical protein
MKPKPTWTEDQQFIIDALAEWRGGHHHLGKLSDFADGVRMVHYGDLCTYDFDRLTSLVVIAHKHAIRVEVAPCNPRTLAIIAHRRKHTPKGERRSITSEHPGLEDLIERSRKEVSND